jgi:chromosome partitioning protein
MKIISFLNSKGGVGKTTLCVNIARYLYLCNSLNKDEHKSRVLLVDSDPQGSIRDWQEAGSQQDIDVIAADRKQTLISLPNVLENQSYDFVLIDTPGKATEISAAAIAISDICLIPIQPSPYDLWASNDISELITTRQTLSYGKPDAFYILNRCIPNSKIGNDVRDYLATCPFPVLGKSIVQRVVYAESAKNGQTIFESDNEGARDDMHVLGKALIDSFERVATS